MFRVKKKLLLYPRYCPPLLKDKFIYYKPHYTKRDVTNITFANSEGSDQTAHLHSLARTFTVHLKKLSSVP